MLCKVLYAAIEIKRHKNKKIKTALKVNVSTFQSGKTKKSHNKINFLSFLT